MKKITGLYDVAIVTHPAYEQTTVGLREASEAIDKAIEEQLKREQALRRQDCRHTRDQGRATRRDTDERSQESSRRRPAAEKRSQERSLPSRKKGRRGAGSPRTGRAGAAFPRTAGYALAPSCHASAHRTRKGNFTPWMQGLGKRMNYLLQEEPNPIMSASSVGAGDHPRMQRQWLCVYRARRGDPFTSGMPSVAAITWRMALLITYSDRGIVEHAQVTQDVLHFPNTFRYMNGFWGIPTSSSQPRRSA